MTGRRKLSKRNTQDDKIGSVGCYLFSITFIVYLDVQVGGREIECIHFADHTVLVAKSGQKINAMLAQSNAAS